MAQFFELFSPRVEESDSQYKLTVGTRNDFEDGKVRIEPPVVLDQDALFFYGQEFEVGLDTTLVGKEATLLSFFVKNAAPPEEPSDMTNRERVEESLKILAKDLGHLSSDAFFRQDY